MPDASQGEQPEWVQRHSVTCALCGGLADERRTVEITAERADVGSALAVDAPATYVATRRLFEQGIGPEVHQSCFEQYREDPIPDPTPGMYDCSEARPR